MCSERQKTSGRRKIVCDWLTVATPTTRSLYKNDSSSGYTRKVWTTDIPLKAATGWYWRKPSMAALPLWYAARPVAGTGGTVDCMVGLL